ncbi:MAG: hypothetical protein U5L96_10850 [Owenweeksia sp.]|nr:hypothetical protein [Owenweeksia sp.]
MQCWNQNGQSRFYKCILAENTGSTPPPQDDSNNNHWQLLTWTKPSGAVSYYPPDAIALVPGSFYDRKKDGSAKCTPRQWRTGTWQ